jgi:hypothetical protein
MRQCRSARSYYKIPQGFGSTVAHRRDYCTAWSFFAEQSRRTRIYTPRQSSLSLSLPSYLIHTFPITAHFLRRELYPHTDQDSKPNNKMKASALSLCMAMLSTGICESHRCRSYLPTPSTDKIKYRCSVGGSASCRRHIPGHHRAVEKLCGVCIAEWRHCTFRAVQHMYSTQYDLDSSLKNLTTVTNAMD